jgi:DNA-directed RNA polymerase specialized sigma24 family protein
MGTRVTDSAVSPEPGDAEDLEEAAAVFMSLRPRLFGIAYRMLSSASEAEDLVQEVWLRWQMYDRSTVVNPAAFLATATTRLAINALQSARVRRETYIGPWLPEPVDTSADPYLGAERGEALEFAALLLMEKLTPMSAPPLCCERRSTTRMRRSLTSCSQPNPRSASWSAGRAST